MEGNGDLASRVRYLEAETVKIIDQLELRGTGTGAIDGYFLGLGRDSLRLGFLALMKSIGNTPAEATIPGVEIGVTPKPSGVEFRQSVAQEGISF